MVFTTPVLNYAQLSPILIVLAGAVIGVLIEAFAPRNARHNSQMFISLFSLVSALAATVSIRNQAGVDAAMNSVAFDGADHHFREKKRPQVKRRWEDALSQ